MQKVGYDDKDTKVVVESAPKTNKQAFLENRLFDNKPHQILASDLLKIALHYRDKDIPILPNGSTPKKYALIQEMKKSFELWQTKVEKFPLAAYVVHEACIFHELNEMLDRLVQKFLQEEKIIDFSNRFPAILSMSDEHLSQFQNLLNSELSEEYIQNLTEDLPGYKRALNSRKNNLCLSDKESIEEMLDLQKLMKKNNYNGFFMYIYTSGSAIAANHFDTFLISEKVIIETVFYPIGVAQSKKEHNENFKSKLYSSSLKGFSPESSGEDLPSPQARDNSLCGSLGLTAKKLLKNNAYELHHHTLLINFYSENKKFNRFFLTSPETLRYSQSHSYNELLKDILMGKDNVRNKPNVYSLEKALNISIRIATEVGDIVTAQENSDLLKKLTKFREEWMKSYNNMLTKRAVLQGERYNHQLEYRALKYKKIGEEPRETSLGELYAQITPHFFKTPLDVMHEQSKLEQRDLTFS